MNNEGVLEIARLADEAHKYPIIPLDDGTGGKLYFEPKSGTYIELPRTAVRKLDVSNVESFIAAVLGEVNRREPDAEMTATFHPLGAICTLDDKAGYGVVNYKRKLSPQWMTLTENLKKSLSHVGFVRLLQALRPSFQEKDYIEIMRAFRKVNLDGSTKIASAPFLENGKAGTEYSVSVEVKSGATDVHLPAGFRLFVPYATGVYECDLEIDLKLVEGSGKSWIAFELVFPGQVVVEDHAVKDEVAQFRQEIKAGAPGYDIIILENF